jgi:hypothetical protein
MACGQLLACIRLHVVSVETRASEHEAASPWRHRTQRRNADGQVFRQVDTLSHRDSVTLAEGTVYDPPTTIHSAIDASAGSLSILLTLTF